MMTNYGDELMARPRRYHPLVARDLADAVVHYDKVSAALGNRFRLAVRDRIATITDRPDSYGRIRERYRAAMLDRFPYVIVFEREEETVSILGIFHAASDRESWFERSV